MHRLNLRTRLAGVLAIPVVMLTMVAIVGGQMNLQLANAFTEVTNRNLPIVRALEELKFAGSRLISSTNELVLDGVLALNAADDDTAEEDDLAGNTEAGQIDEAITNYQTAFTDYRQLTADEPEDAEIVSAIAVSGQALIDISNNLVDMEAQAMPLADILEVRESFEDAEVTFLAAVDDALAFEADELMVSQSNVDSAMSNLDIARTAILLTTILLTSSIGFFVFLSIVRPVQALKSASDKLRAGDLRARADLTSSDEIGQLARSFNQMADELSQNIVELERREQEALEARAQAERSDQVKSAFLASMSHELRTPLNSVINFTKFVVRGVMGPVNEKQEETLNKVINSGQHLLSLINDVLDMSKIESGSLNLFIEDDLEVQSIMDTVVDFTEGLLKAEGKPVELLVEVDEHIPAIRGDRKRLTQIILNLMSNAAKFTDEGYIKLKAYVEHDEIMISVEDTGMGIAADDFAGVFEPFRQTKSGLRQGGGTGLGMPISKSLVEAHGGRLWFESELNHGSTFHVALPVKSAMLAPTPA